MSSRALKKLHGKDDLAIIEKSLTSTKAHKTNSGANSSEDEDRSEEEFVSTPKKQNLFSLVLEDEELSSGNDETVQEIIPNASKSTKKKKNKKKNKRNKSYTWKAFALT
ncbi:hypothetical protein EB796_016174 [Bugula neritina]|uniref:Uncharacterized protein n=1 Tax=Bugula neritina TaxID=10212 RepID=A0A7J7JGZ8_BUGNE|nr:hypothetical protein EB796_016174 [Bugula neritina]